MERIRNNFFDLFYFDWNWLRRTGAQFIIFDKAKHPGYEINKQQIDKFTSQTGILSI